MPGALDGERTRGHDALAAEEARLRAVYGRRGSPARETYLDAGQLFMLQGQERAVLRALREQGVARLAPLRVLEIGCGSGRWLRQFVQWGADPRNVAGVDVLQDRVERARACCPPAMTIEVANAAALPFADGSFDVVLQSVVLSSVPDAAMRRRVAAEMRRVARPGGLILSYDLRVPNPANPDVQPLTRGQLRALFPDCPARWRRVTLAPPLSRLVGPRSWLLATLLEAVPFLRTHWLAVLRVPVAGRPP